MRGVPETFSFTTINVPGAATGYTNSQTIYGINDRGEVAGTYFDQNLSVHGFIDRNGTFTTVDVPTTVFPPGVSIETEVHAINNKGEVAGQYFAQGGLGPSFGFIDDHGVFSFINVPASISGIPGLSTFAFTEISGINNKGGVVGTYSDGIHGIHGYIGNNGTFTSIDFPGGTDTNAEGINDRGDVVGSYATVDSETQVHGFIDQGGVLTTIDVPGAMDTDVHGINDKGILVGTYTDSSMTDHGFIYDKGHFTTIDFPGASATEAWGINDRGEIAGDYTDSNGNSHGFVANPLKDLVTKQQVTLSMSDFASGVGATTSALAPQGNQSAQTDALSGSSVGTFAWSGSSDTTASNSAVIASTHAGAAMS